MSKLVTESSGGRFAFPLRGEANLPDKTYGQALRRRVLKNTKGPGAGTTPRPALGPGVYLTNAVELLLPVTGSLVAELTVAVFTTAPPDVRCVRMLMAST
jgi:hypothetical protein